MGIWVARISTRWRKRKGQGTQKRERRRVETDMRARSENADENMEQDEDEDESIHQSLSACPTAFHCIYWGGGKAWLGSLEMIKILRIFCRFWWERLVFGRSLCNCVAWASTQSSEFRQYYVDKKIIPVTRINQDQLHSVIQFALIMTELWKTFEEASLVNTDCCLCGQKIRPNWGIPDCPVFNLNWQFYAFLKLQLAFLSFSNPSHLTSLCPRGARNPPEAAWNSKDLTCICFLDAIASPCS